MKTDPAGGYFCPDAVKHVVTSPEEAQARYNEGCGMRATASTNMNSESSRSHALLILQVAWVEKKGKSFAALNLVDLAGSEGMKKTGATGANMKEGIKINLSLTKLAFVVKCLAEGAKHIPFRESKLTMMLQKGLAGKSLLHIILALSNSKLQVQEGTACLRFGQSCLSMTVNASANAMEKEQQEMRSVIKEQIQEINTLQDENEQLRRELEEEKARKASVAADDIPDFLIAQHIALNKDALMDDLKEADEEIVALRQALEEKGEEMAALEATSIEEQLAGMTDGLAGMDGQQAAEIMEQKRNAIMKERMQVKAKLQQEKLAFEKELDQVRDATPTRRASCALAPHLAPPDNPPSTPSTPSTPHPRLPSPVPSPQMLEIQ